MTRRQPVRILCVDDDPGLARLLQKAIQRAGYLADIAPDGDEGLEAFRSGVYDVLVVDHQMPGKTGLEMIRILGSEGELPPTIMVTGAGNELVAVEAMKLGAADYLIKDPDGGYLSLIPSVIEQTLARKRLLEQKQKADEAVRQSERLKTVGQLAGGVAHNFNNLLQIIMGNAQLALANLELGDLSDLKSDLELILDTSKLGTQTVKHLQSFAQLRSDVSAEQGTVLDLSDVVRQAIDMTKIWWQTEPERNGIMIALDHSPEAGCLVRGRAHELLEVAVNLIKNAVEAMPDGGKIHLDTSSDKDQVRFTVTDTGVGIADHEVGRIFEPFYTTKGVQSTGMGLAGSYGIVTSHGGALSVRSEKGEGSRFEVVLPLAHEIRGQSEVEGLQNKDGAGGQILVVDDMPEVCRILAIGLGAHGYSVLTAQSGEEALEVFRKRPVHALICDLGMAGMTGWEVGKRIRQQCADTGRCKVPFVLLTGWGGQTCETERMIESGIDLVLEKPVDIREIAQVLGDLLVSGKKLPVRLQ